MIVRTENAIIDMNKVDAVILHETMNQLMFMCGNNIIRVNYPNRKKATILLDEIYKALVNEATSICTVDLELK